MPERSREAALFSVSDKRGVEDVARALHERGVAIYATGGTRTYLVDRGVPAHDVESLTGFPALFGGRVKTLHPKVFGAILYDRGNEEHRAQIEQYAMPSIVAVVVNLYPFEATVAREGTTLEEAIEQIDIGGVALLRAAAKNAAHVAVLTDPSQYPNYLAALENGEVPNGLRRRLAVAAFERTASYDIAISHYLATKGELLPSDLPGALTLALPLAQRLRYGTNPQERAAFYLGREDRVPEQLHGKALSYNNLLDLDATLRLLSRAATASRRVSVATIPPNAETGSAAIASRTAFPTVERCATPHGTVCFTTAARTNRSRSLPYSAPSAARESRRSVASRSSKLLYESAFP